ncbi:MFS transporter [Vibrio splendidus]
MKIDRRIFAFLVVSFLSSFGDTLLVLALPMGIGQETGNISIALIAWFVPSIAMVISSYFSKAVKNRRESERVDYGMLLLAIAFCEVGFGIGIFMTDSYELTILLIIGFVFLYALAKEGISRLIYNVSIYKFFCSDKDYANLSGKKAGLDIAAGLLGVVGAAYLVGTGDWRMALIIDAATFVLLATLILFLGRDNHPTDLNKPEEEQRLETISEAQITHVKWIAIGFPVLHAVNALYAYFQPLIVERADIMTAEQSLLFLALMRLPSMVGGFYFNRLIAHLAVHRIVVICPMIYISASALFVMMPNTLTMLLTMFAGGLNIAVYMPAFVNILNALPRNETIEVNKIVLRAIGYFQGSACLISMYLYSSSDLPSFSVIGAMAVYLLLGLIPAGAVNAHLNRCDARISNQNPSEA